MTKQTNNKPQSLDDYFARAKETKPGMSSKQASDLIAAAPATKLSWFAYIKPLANKINSILLVSALLIITYFSVDFDYEQDAEVSDKSSAIAKDVKLSNVAVEKNIFSNQKDNAGKQKHLALSESIKDTIVDKQFKNTVHTKNTVKEKNTVKSDSSVEQVIVLDNLIAGNMLILPSQNITVMHEYTINQTIKYYPVDLPSAKTEEKEEEDIQTMQTLAGNNPRNAYYFQADSRFTKTSIDRALFVGGKIAWMPSDCMSFGLMGYGMTDKPIINIIEENSPVDAYLYAGYGGIFMEYYFMPTEIIHFYLGTAFGLGGVHATPVLNSTAASTNINNSIFWLVEPNMGVELNISSFLKIGVDVSYRYSELSAKDKYFAQSSDLTDFNISGFATGIYFKLGLY